MIQNNNQGSPPWLQHMSDKNTKFRQEIRQRQLEAWKSEVRCRLNLIINYSDPQGSVARMVECIARGDPSLSYVPVFLNQIISVIHQLLTNFSFVQQFASQRVLQNILVAIAELGSNGHHLITTWLQVFIATLDSWPHLWCSLYESSVSILWAILGDKPQNEIQSQQIQVLFQVWSQKYSIPIEVSEESIVSLLSKTCCSYTLQIISDHMNPAVQDCLQSNNLIKSNLHYLDSPACNAFLLLLSRAGFLEQEVTQLIHEKLIANTVNKEIAMKILYDQMYLTDDDLLQFVKMNPELDAFVKQILEHDF